MSFKKIWVVVSLACLPVTASFAQDQYLEVGVGQQKNFTMTCKAKNFYGVVEGTVGNHFQTGKWIHTTRYKITRLNGQSGGNKANIHLYAAKAPNDNQGKVESSNNMKQDGQWHSLSLRRSNMGVGDAQVESYVWMAFDKSGPDPKCWSNSVYF